MITVVLVLLTGLIVLTARPNRVAVCLVIVLIACLIVPVQGASHSSNIDMSSSNLFQMNSSSYRCSSSLFHSISMDLLMFLISVNMSYHSCC